MGVVVTLQHNGKRDLCGCMIMQSTTWPWRAGVSGCRQSNVLRSKRTLGVRESCLRLGSELLVTVRDAITGFGCDWCSSRLLSSSVANQNELRSMRLAISRRIDRALNFSASWGRVYWVLSAESMRLAKRHAGNDIPQVQTCHDQWGGGRKSWLKGLSLFVRIYGRRPCRNAAKMISML